MAEGEALARRLQLEHSRDLLHTFGEAHRLHLQRELAAFDTRDVERAFDQRQQMVAAAADHADRLLSMRRNGLVFVEQLGVADDAVQRRAQLVADGRDVAALRLIREIGSALGLLQRLVGAAVRFDFVHQRLRLAVAFFLRHLPAFVRQHQPPGDDRGDDDQRREHLHEAHADALGDRLAHAVGVVDQLLQFVLVDQIEDHAEQRHDDRHQQQVAAKLGVQARPQRARQYGARRGLPLGGPARLRLAHVVAARVE